MNQKTLDNLKIIEIYGFYDKPLLFSCKNESELFFALCVDGSDFTETWFYAPISNNRLQSIHNGDVELRHVFNQAECDFIYQVEIAVKNEKILSVFRIKCAEIADEDLPEAGEFIHLPTIALNQHQIPNQSQGVYFPE
jgi:hypothetical protein